MRAYIKSHHHHTGQRRLAYIRGRGPLHLHLRTRVRRARSITLLVWFQGERRIPTRKEGKNPNCVEKVKGLNLRADESETALGMGWMQEVDRLPRGMQFVSDHSVREYVR
jgi:hypothetical protein